MLSPSILVPPITVLYTEVHSTWHSGRKPVEDPGHVPEQIRIDGRSVIYIEHTSRDIAVLPKHVMSASLRVENLQIPLDVDFYGPDPVKHPPRRWGVQTYDDQITCTAPGTAVLHLSAAVPPQVREALARTHRSALYDTWSSWLYQVYPSRRDAKAVRPDDGTHRQ